MSDELKQFVAKIVSDQFPC